MFASPAYAQAVGAESAGAVGIVLQMAPLLLIFVIFYFLLIRPQQKRAAEQRASIEAVRKGDTVVTAGGIVGKVTKVDAAEVEVEIATGVRARVVKATLAEIRPLAGAKPAND